MARKRGVGDAAVMVASARVQVRNDWMPGLRIRHDGWTQARTQRFLDTLTHTCCALDAARVAGLSSQAGYRLKQPIPPLPLLGMRRLTLRRRGRKNG